ncbi:DUF4834 family protein [Sediminitomix flava]|uniref:Uncharacterized protein DUF4834 n=1 Tax=Sediminitomix flava TaxID=379075 RepID=A0A315Z9W2_SEDFL|nr:DUF4834 family protein [Sediminitomix flava]PWJ42365.1 uncharacterized protein DUF4834 [Sediminitomix flava]
MLLKVLLFCIIGFYVFARFSGYIFRFIYRMFGDKIIAKLQREFAKNQNFQNHYYQQTGSDNRNANKNEGDITITYDHPKSDDRVKKYTWDSKKDRGDYVSFEDV